MIPTPHDPPQSQSVGCDQGRFSRPCCSSRHNPPGGQAVRRALHSAVGLLVTALFFLLTVSSPASADDRSWSALDGLRTTLEKRSPLSVDFEQSLIPRGFSAADAEVESGVLSMNLPQCLRWDYTGDFAKSFLLCDDKGYYWNPGETVGQLYALEDRADTPGLDFFLRTSAQLKGRYSATSSVDGSRLVIDLTPLLPSQDVRKLRVVLDAKSFLLEDLSYEDGEGNRTGFKLSNLRGGATKGVFVPPPAMTWQEQ